MIYAGIGSRETPETQLKAMTIMAGWFGFFDFTLRSGGAQGADQAFEEGAKSVSGDMEIYLPWNGFEEKWADYQSYYLQPSVATYKKAEAIAAHFHPVWNRLSERARKLQTRNVFQVLGWDLESPSDFVICWTPDGKASGGTGQAIRIAQAYNIPVYNIYNSVDVTALHNLFKEIGS